MNTDILTLLVRVSDIQRSLTYIIKNTAHNDIAARVALGHVNDIMKSLESCSRVLDEVIRLQSKTV